MSTLTKIMIVLLTFSVFWLCAGMVTYVSITGNYKKLYDDSKNTEQLAVSSKNKAEQQLDEKKKAYAQQEDKLKKQIASFRTRVDKTENEIRNLKRENAELLQRVSNMSATVGSASKTADSQTHLFEDAQEKLRKITAEQIKDRKKLDDLTAELIEKMAIIENQEITQKQLLEEKYDLQNKLDQFLFPKGRTVAFPKLVTPIKAFARPAEPAVTRDIDLRALVTVVDLKNKMAGISIGASAGVKIGMKFHVTRGDEFICDIVILDVDTEKSVGFLDLVQQQPKAGDSVSTNF